MLGSTRYLILVAFLLRTASSSFDNGEQKERCEEITIPMCMGIGYNLTRMPNKLNHTTQEQAGLELHQFWPLVEIIKCSLDLKLFLCSTYAPICLPGYKKPLPPCRSLCRRARKDCKSIMTDYGIKWPKKINCRQFPVQRKSSKHRCLKDPYRGNPSVMDPFL